MTAPTRIQRSRAPGWRMPADAIYVGRPTRWGNPFVIGKPAGWPYSEFLVGRVRDRAHATELFRVYARITVGYGLLVRQHLAGRDLACWCPLDQPCHADVLLELANTEPESTR